MAALSPATERLRIATRSGSAADICAALLDGGDVHAPAVRSKPFTIGLTGLTTCARGGHHAAARLLLDAGAVVNGPAEHGYSPLMVAAAFADLKVLSMLIEAGAHVNAADVDGDTPLHLAMMRPVASCVQRLLAAGARADAVNHAGNTPAQTVRGAPLLANLHTTAPSPPLGSAQLEARLQTLSMPTRAWEAVPPLLHAALPWQRRRAAVVACWV
jgi:hypothetical protein